MLVRWHLTQGTTQECTISRVSHGQTWSVFDNDVCLPKSFIHMHCPERNSPFPCSGQPSLPLLLLFLCTSDLQHVYFSVRLLTELLRLLPTASCNSIKNRNMSSKREICLYPCLQSWGGIRDQAEGLRPHYPGSWSWLQRRKKAGAGDRGRPWWSTEEKSIECTYSM